MASDPESSLFSAFFRNCLPWTGTRTISNQSSDDPKPRAQPTVGSAQDGLPMKRPVMKLVAPALAGGTPGAATWKTLIKALQAFESNLDFFPPLKTAIGGLVSCAQHVKTVQKSQADYRSLASDLTSLVGSLQSHLPKSRPTRMPYSISNVARAIEEHTEYLKQKREQHIAVGYVMAKEDNDDVLDRYRRVQALFCQLQAVHLLLNEACQRAAVRLAACPDDHPLHKAVKKASKGRKKHIPPLQHILRFANCKPSDFEKWPLNQRPRVQADRGDFPTRARAIINANTDDSHVKVYSDGASAADGVSAAAVLRVFGQPPKVAGFRLGDLGDHSILDAELAGILIAAHLVLASDTVDDATIFTDSQEAISCINGKAQGATQALLKAVRRALRKAREHAGGIVVRVQWCPGHAGIAGNEAADVEASAAMRGKTYPPSLIPPALLNYRPPTNPTTLKRKLQQRNRDAATAHWLASKPGSRFSARFPGISAGDFLAHTHSLPRSSATLLFRLTTGHVQLRRHLHRLQVENTPFCAHCDDDEETVAHFLLHCPRHAPERYLYLESQGPDFSRLDFLLFSSEALGPLFDYVKATGRFADLLK